MDGRQRLAAIPALLLIFASLQVWGQAKDYRAPLQPVNPGITEAGLSGEVHFLRHRDELQITIEAEGLAPEVMHMQHLHGSRDGMDATCAPMVTEPGQEDVVDVFDIREYSGITLIPLHENPLSLEIETDTYPVSNRAGNYTYKQTVDWPALEQAMTDHYGIEYLELGRMVVYVHGVAEDKDLPESVRSPADVPAHMTLPVACAELDIQPAQR